MTVISVVISDNIKEKLKIWNNISYESFLIKTIWREYINSDLKFTSYEKMSEEHKKKYQELDNIDESMLLNI